MENLPANYKIIETHIDNIMVGDTVLCEDGLIRTVSKNNIHSFGGERTLFGDSYHLGYKKVKKIIIQRVV